jgi:hypothetical protein
VKKVVFWDLAPCSLVRTNVSEECIASIFRAGESRREYSEQVAFFIVIAMKISNLKYRTVFSMGFVQSGYKRRLQLSSIE